MHNLSVSLWDLRTIPLWSKWTKDLTLYCLNKIKEIIILLLQNSRKPVRQTILLIGIIWWVQFQSSNKVLNNTWIYVYIKELDKISTPIPTPTPESFNSNSNSGSFNSNSNSGQSPEYQLQLQLREFQLQLQLRQVSWISTPTPTPEVSTPIPTPELELELNPTPTPTPELTPTLFWDTAISKFHHENPWSRSCVWSKVKVMFDLHNSKVKVMVKVKPIGHIWSLEFNRYVCFSFRGNRTNFGWDIGNSIFDLENSRSRSWPRSSLMVIFEALSSIDMFAFLFVAIRPFLAGI